MFLSVLQGETGGVVTLDRGGRVAIFHVDSIGLCQCILQFRPNEGKAKIEKFLKEKKLENSEVVSNRNI